MIQESPTLPEIIDLQDNEEKDDDTARIVKPSSRNPFQACYHNLIVITDEDEIRVSDNKIQQQPDPASSTPTTPTSISSEKLGSSSVSTRRSVEKEVIVIDDLDDDGLLDDTDVQVKVLPVVEEDTASSLSCSAYTKQSSYFPPSIDL